MENMDYRKLSRNQKRIIQLMNIPAEYWIIKRFKNNKQGFLWRMNYYDDTDEFKVNNWSVNALIKKGWLEVEHLTVPPFETYGNDFAVITDKAKTELINYELNICRYF